MYVISVINKNGFSLFFLDSSKHMLFVDVFLIAFLF